MAVRPDYPGYRARKAGVRIYYEPCQGWFYEPPCLPPEGPFHTYAAAGLEADGLESVGVFRG